MLKNKIAIFCLCFQFDVVYSQNLDNSIGDYFKEIKKATAKHIDLWQLDLYNPVLLVNPQSREIYANVADSANNLHYTGKFYKGKLPDSVNIANTAVNWNGIKWAMIQLPLAEEKADRIGLMAHELFHVAQPRLGFVLGMPENNHLDQSQGRIYLKLELEALKKAVSTDDKTEQKKHITHALMFRKYRYILFPNVAKTENELELMEGMAEYTGFVVSGRKKQDIKRYFEQRIKVFYRNSTFVRSFAYETVPMYGHILKRFKKNWQSDIKQTTDLMAYFSTELGISLLDNVENSVKMLTPLYNCEQIIKEENQREEKNKQIIADYKRKFIEQVHFDLPFIAMNVSFDPRNIVPIEDKGTVYPNIRVTDKWGILTVEKGALMSANWDKITLTPPQYFDKNKVSGEGWMLELQGDFMVLKDDKNGLYFLKNK